MFRGFIDLSPFGTGSIMTSVRLARKFPTGDRDVSRYRIDTADGAIEPEVCTRTPPVQGGGESKSRI